MTTVFKPTPRTYLKWQAEVDYLSKLPAEERAWLEQYDLEFYCDHFKSATPLHTDKREIRAANSRARVDAFSLLASGNALIYGHAEVNGSQDDETTCAPGESLIGLGEAYDRRKLAKLAARRSGVPIAELDARPKTSHPVPLPVRRLTPTEIAKLNLEGKKS